MHNSSEMSETNTVVIYGLQSSDFKGQDAAGLYTTAKNCGELLRWIPIRALRRAIAVYPSATEANAAYKALERSLTSSQVEKGIRIGHGVDSIDIESADTVTHLKLPDRGRLLLVSPPASPPSEWSGEASLEESPNRNTHMDRQFDIALEQALRGVPANSPLSAVSDTDDPQQKSSSVTLLHPTETSPGLSVDLHGES